MTAAEAMLWPLVGEERARILAALSVRVQSVDELAKAVGRTQPSTSKNLKALREIEWVLSERCATQRTTVINRLNPVAIGSLRNSLDDLMRGMETGQR